MPIEVRKDGFQTLTIPVTGKYKIEIVAPGTGQRLFKRFSIPGVRIVAKFKLKRGQKITAALGQQPRFGFDGDGGSGGSFLVLETEKEPKLLLAAGGAGCSKNQAFGEGRFERGLEKIDISGAGYTVAPVESKFSKVEGRGRQKLGLDWLRFSYFKKKLSRKSWRAFFRRNFLEERFKPKKFGY